MLAPFSYRNAMYIFIVLFWLITSGLLLHRHYGSFNLSDTSLRTSFDLLNNAEEQWMGVYLRGEKIGYQSRKISPAPHGYTMNEAFRIKILFIGNKKDVETLLNAKMDNNLKLLSFTATIKSDLDMELSGTVQGKNLSLTINSGGVKTTKKMRLDREPSLEGPAVTGMLKGLKPGDRISVPIFDPALLGVEDFELKVASKEKLMSLGKLRETYKVTGKMKSIEFTVWVTETGEVLREESPSGFLLVKETKEDALKTGRPSLDLISQTAVPLRMKLPADTSYLKIRITGVDFKDLDLEGGRQKLNGNELEIQKEVINAEMLKQRTEIKGQSFDKYLKDTILIQSTDQQVVSLAREIVKEEKDPLVKARSIYDWVYQNIEKVPTITIPMATDVLMMKRGDCNEHTTLFTALSRAAGIPSKMVVGLVYRDGFFYYHAWPEFYAGQWIAADPTLGQFPADASHIRLVTGDLDRQIQILPLINKIRIEGLGYR